MNKLQTIIEYAIDNGYKPWGSNPEPIITWESFIDTGTHMVMEFEATLGDDDPLEPLKFKMKKCAANMVMSHDFLKAVFGEGKFMAYYAGYNEWYDATEETDADDYYDDKQHNRMPNWQYHAQQMVISEDPVDYIWKYIEGQNNG